MSLGIWELYWESIEDEYFGMVMVGKCENHFENIVLYALIWKWLRWVASYVIYIYICRCIWRRYKRCKEKQQWEFLVVWSYITIFLFSFFCHFRGRIQINLSLENGSTTQMWDFLYNSDYRMQCRQKTWSGFKCGNLLKKFFWGKMYVPGKHIIDPAPKTKKKRRKNLKYCSLCSILCL